MRSIKTILLLCAALLLAGLVLHSGVFTADGGHPLPSPWLTADGGHPLPSPWLTADGGHPLPSPWLGVAS
jgi:hypothetical protein